MDERPAPARRRAERRGDAARVAQVGCGYWGRNLARNFAELGALAAVVDGDAEAAGRIATEHAVPAATLASVLADDSIGAVALATPAATHGRLAARALAAGKHVYVEKPLALEVGEAEALIARAETAGRVLMVGHLLQYHPVFRRLAGMVAAGELGRLVYVYSNRLSLGKFRIEENALWSFAPHDISMILSLAGEAPARIDAQGAAHVTPGIADWATVQFAFPSGLRAHVHASWLHPFKEHRLVAVGERAMAVFEDSRPDWSEKLAVYRHGIDRAGPVPVPVAARPEFVEIERGEPLKEECRHFLACCAEGGRPRTDGAEGLAVLRALAAAESALGRWLAER